MRSWLTLMNQFRLFNLNEKKKTTTKNKQNENQQKQKTDKLLRNNTNQK